MINPFDYASDKSLYPAQSVGMCGGLVGMKIWLFPLAFWTGLTGFLLTIATTGASLFVTLVVTGLYTRHKEKILNFFDIKISKPKFLRYGKRKKGNTKAA